jgi:RNA polymerase sigma-70 factor (ECF subfamily)
VSDVVPAGPDHASALLAVYDRALPQVYGYLLPRCEGASVAEDLTAETFLAADTSVQRGVVREVTTAWLVGIARHKLVDHWRRRARDERKLQLASDAEQSAEVGADQWDDHLDAVRAHEVLAALGAHHRLALTLRYLDGLSVPEVAEQLERTVHATEALLVRARTAFRRAYEEGSDDG